MRNLLQGLYLLILQLFGKIENHTKPPELDGGAPDHVVQEPPPKDAEDPEGVPDLGIEPSWTKAPEKALPSADDAVLTHWDIIEDVLERPFIKPQGYALTRVPTSDRYASGGIYDTYGRAPKETGNSQYPKAQLKVHEGLVGTWNGAKPGTEVGKGNARLYMERDAGSHLREALLRAEELEIRISKLKGVIHKVLSYITKMGSFSHRHIRHDPENELSFHSWAIACDLNPPWNRGVSYADTWQKRSGGSWVECEPYQAQRGPVNTILPFSKQYHELYPKALPVELVMAFKSVNFCWGGDWGRSKWHEVVKKFGSGYDQNDASVANSEVFKEAMKEWKSIRFYDPMHFELTLRMAWAKAHYDRTKA